VEFGLERTISAKESLIGSIDRLGLSLSEVTSELLIGLLKNTTVIVIGWNGFDLDISPLFIKHATKVLWLCHTPDPDDSRQRCDEVTDTIERVRSDLRSKGFGEAKAELLLLSCAEDYPMAVLPAPDHERTLIVSRSPESAQIKVCTPELISRLWSIVNSDGGPGQRAPASPNPLAEPRLSHFTINRWSESLPKFLPLRWALGRLFLNHGEYESTNEVLKEVLDAVATDGLNDIAAMLQLDLGDLNAIYGKRAEAEQAYRDAVGLYEKEIVNKSQEQWVINRRQIGQIPERAYFGIGEVACEFYDFGTAAAAFGEMPTDPKIVRALVHYCRENFDEANRLLSEIAFVRLGPTRFHYYLYYFLKLTDARIHLARRNLDLAVKELHEILTAVTKLGLPRLQVQALNGLSVAYSPHLSGRLSRAGLPSLGSVDPYSNDVKAAQFARQAIVIANQAEYRYGRADAGYLLGIICAGEGLPDVATDALRCAEDLFDRIGHPAGLAFCRRAKALYHLAWESTRPLPKQEYEKAPDRFSSGSLSGFSIRQKHSNDDLVGTLPESEEPCKANVVDICWLDFWGGSPSGLEDLLRDAGFSIAELTNGLQVWSAPDFPDILLEILNVDSYPQEPVSKVPGVTAEQIDEDRRRTCVPLCMDPYYQCMLYAPDQTRPAEILFDQLSEARSRLYSRFVDIAFFPGADVRGEWALWRRKPLPKCES
jgi:tetratricopeptide (TPR) repeat protein